MGYRNRFLLSVISVFRSLLYCRVKSTLSNKNIENLGINDSKPVFYITRYRSLTDALVLETECRNADLPRPFVGTTIKIPSSDSESTTSANSKQFCNNLIPLTRPGITENSSKTPRYFSEKLQALVDIALQDPEFDVQLVPASVFWGRSPKTVGSFWQAAFSDSWTIPGLVRKFFMVILKGRQTYVQLSKPFSLRQILDKEADSQLALAKTHRLIRRRMKMQREAFIGPDLSHRRTLLLSILETPEIRARIEKQATAEETTVEVVRKKALHFANEIAADYSHSVIRAMHSVLRWLWTKIYNGVQVRGGRRLQQLAQENAIVYVPCHRSHFDYLLLSYVLYDNLELVPPHIAAGVNLNLPFVGPILRRGGAFFMRRSFKDNPLYAAIFSEYLHRVLERGFAIEYFIEGGRSRTGRQLQPKPGMIAMTLESYASSNQKPLMFVPVNFCYERLFEGKSYLGELRGQKKRKETLTQFLRSLKRIKENFGHVHVTFGEPIPAEEFLQSEGIASSTDFQHLPYREQKQVSLKLGNLISTRINAAANAHAIALLSVAIQATPKQAIEEELLVTQLELLIDYLKLLPYSDSQGVTNLSPQEIIQYGENLDYICRYPNQFGDIIFATEKQAQYLSYFRNNILHFFAIPSVVALLYCTRQELKASNIVDQAKEFYSLLKPELFLQWETNEIDGPIQSAIAFMEQKSLLSSDARLRNLELFAGIIKPSLERFAIVLILLEKSGSATLTPKELEVQAKIHAERVSRLYQSNSPEYFDSKLFNNLVQKLFDAQLASLNTEGKLIFSEPLHTAARKTEIILGSNLHHTLWTQNE